MNEYKGPTVDEYCIVSTGLYKLLHISWYAVQAACKYSQVEPPNMFRSSCMQDLVGPLLTPSLLKKQPLDLFTYTSLTLSWAD